MTKLQIYCMKLISRGQIIKKLEIRSFDDLGHLISGGYFYTLPLNHMKRYEYSKVK